MILTTVLPHGHVALGPDAEAVGFVAGAVISIVVLSTGSILLRLDDEPAIEADCRRLAWHERRGLVNQRGGGL